MSILLAACASAPVNAQSGEPVLLVTTKNPDDQMDIQYEKDAAHIDIYSPSGIGSAAFELKSGRMPGKITLRLHLKGLEQLRLTSAQDQISASVSGGDTIHVDHQAILSSGTESPLSPDHPLWMEIEIVSGQAEKKIPLEAGYFEVVIPQQFIRNAGKTFEVEWIDFYR